MRGRIVENIRVRLIIEGHVQGVWFRESTRRQASALGVTGWVRNRPDRSVEVVAEGPAEKVEKLVAWCHKGPPAAEVRRVSQTIEPSEGLIEAFEVRYR
jgi:acylphosphatase